MIRWETRIPARHTKKGLIRTGPQDAMRDETGQTLARRGVWRGGRRAFGAGRRLLRRFLDLGSGGAAKSWCRLRDAHPPPSSAAKPGSRFAASSRLVEQKENIDGGWMIRKGGRNNKMSEGKRDA